MQAGLGNNMITQVARYTIFIYVYTYIDTHIYIYSLLFSSLVFGTSPNCYQNQQSHAISQDKRSNQQGAPLPVDNH